MDEPTKKKSIEDDDFGSSDAYEIYTKTLAQQHEVYLSDTIESDSTAYVKLFKDLKNMSSNDVLNIHLANFGGSCHQGLRLCNILKSLQVRQINMLVEGPCYSMGAILAVSGTSLRMAPGSFLMFHNFTSYDSGKGAELKMSVEEFATHWRYSMENLCCPFLTKKELEFLHTDRDIYIREQNTVELEQRKQRHFAKKKGK